MQNLSLRRRQLLAGLGAGIALPVLSACGASPAEAKDYPFSLSDAEWQRRLGKARYRILREAGTEGRFTSALLHEKRKGTFVCAGCKSPLYSSATKYESGTGWPAFWKAIPGAIETSTDTSFGMVRTEARCATCGGHLGHIFKDGPRPTGKRHCINGLAMEFRPA